MAVVLMILRAAECPWYAGAPAAGLLYGGMLLLTGAVRREEIKLLTALLRSPRQLVAGEQIIT
jgi:hypothetical protein